MMTKTYLDVFDRDDEEQRPSDQRYHAEDRLLACLAEFNQRLADRIKRRCTDIAIDDAECGDRQAANQATFQGLSFNRIYCRQGKAQPAAARSAEAPR